MNAPRHQHAKAPALKETPRRDWSIFRQHWTTADEVDFLTGLGRNIWCVSSLLSRQAALHHYLDAMPRRVDWRNIDAHAVRAVCMGMIEEINGTLYS